VEESAFSFIRGIIVLSTVYGPVPSWRFGRSLGIDVVVPPKTCSFNCIYCQLGRTKVKLSNPTEFKNYVTANDVERDLEKYLADIDVKSIDVVTFSGSGEPTLNPDIGNIVDCVRRLTSGKVPIVLLTNSSLLYRDDIRRKVAKFDVVVAKLDAGDEKTYRIINRPVKDAPDIEVIKESIKKLKKEMNGMLMTQTMFLHTDFDFTNCEGEALTHLMNAFVDIEPDTIQIDTPYRPGGEKFLKPASVDELKTIAKSLEDFMEKMNVHPKLWVFGVHDKRGRKVAWKEHVSVSDETMELLKRRPCRIVDISDSIGISYSESLRSIKNLLKKRLIVERISSNGEKYYYPV
jgi:wyosine [tRNA(Phe)-imidazoG37] synthetase (radical SAM superfamily)